MVTRQEAIRHISESDTECDNAAYRFRLKNSFRYVVLGLPEVIETDRPEFAASAVRMGGGWIFDRETGEMS